MKGGSRSCLRVSTMNKPALIADRRYEKHFAGRVHPERAERIEAMIDMAEQLERPDEEIYAPREASGEEIALSPHPDYVPAGGGHPSKAPQSFLSPKPSSPENYQKPARP